MTLIYNGTKATLAKDVFNIDNIIEGKFQEILWRKLSATEKLSHKNSLLYMSAVLNDQELPEDCGVAIEYHIPQTSKRIDFIVTWRDKDNKEHVIIIELKQRSEAQISDKDWLVLTRFKHGVAETSHPSYQARSYAALLVWYNETVYKEDIQLKPCAYLHNYEQGDGVLKNDFYKEYLEKAPVFLKEDHQKLQDFIKQFVKYGDNSKIMYRIDKSEIRPSKALADSMASLLKGNKEFIMIDDQKVVYENAISLAKSAKKDTKNILIVEWWPGTWKSVVAINLLVDLTKAWLVTKYVTKNAAPRTVYESKLTGTLKKTEFSNLFTGSWSFVKCPPDTFGALIIDEAHRLNAKSGMFKNLGENQIKELIHAAKCSIFFIDEDQKVTLSDIGEKEEIKKRAKFYKANVYEFTLSSQFRCNGADWYLAWLDYVLQIRETANITLDDVKYDFQIVSSPNALRDMIFEKNKVANKARLVAGYCWDWKSKKDKNAYDINIPEHDFHMRRNLASDGNLWILNPQSVSEIGCIHTCQWLEVDYIGVIVGEDLVVRNGVVVTNPAKRSTGDASIKWYKTLLKNDPVWWEEMLDKIIKNTYRTLMTRGMKGCYVYFTDKETEEYFKSRIATELL